MYLEQRLSRATSSSKQNIRITHKSEVFTVFSISVPNGFPIELPEVKEVGGEISRTPENHVNDDGTLCLGSPLRLRQKLAKQPDLLGFAQLCLVPFLYGHWYGRKFRILWPFGELPHGPDGAIEDYRDLFGLETDQQVRQVLQILSLPEKEAKRMLCPCGCGKRLRSCKFNGKTGALSLSKLEGEYRWKGRALT